MQIVSSTDFVSVYAHYLICMIPIVSQVLKQHEQHMQIKHTFREHILFLVNNYSVHYIKKRPKMAQNLIVTLLMNGYVILHFVFSSEYKIHVSGK